MSCPGECKTDNQALPVPFQTHQADMARMERANRRLWILCLVMLALFVVSNAIWIWRETQYVDEVTETIETSTEGGGNAYGTIVSGNNSEVRYGENQSDKD